VQEGSAVGVHRAVKVLRMVRVESRTAVMTATLSFLTEGGIMKLKSNSNGIKK
jgi:hypothetical protein